MVDEAHLIPRSAETRYGRFLAGLAALTPAMRVVGFTATPYRLDSGRLDEGPGRLFSGIAYEADTGDLIRRGYLAPLVSKATLTQLDVTGVGRRGGDYIPSELEAAVNRDWITRAAVSELAEYGSGRRSWLAFCAGLAHAAAVRDAVREEGYSCETVDGGTPSASATGSWRSSGPARSAASPRWACSAPASTRRRSTSWPCSGRPAAPASTCSRSGGRCAGRRARTMR